MYHWQQKQNYDEDFQIRLFDLARFTQYTVQSDLGLKTSHARLQMTLLRWCLLLQFVLNFNVTLHNFELYVLNISWWKVNSAKRIFMKFFFLFFSRSKAAVAVNKIKSLSLNKQICQRISRGMIKSVERKTCEVKFNNKGTFHTAPYSKQEIEFSKPSIIVRNKKLRRRTDISNFSNCSPGSSHITAKGLTSILWTS